MIGVDRGADATLVEHDVQVILVPECGEDLPGDSERRSTVMVLFDRLRESECNPPRLLDGDGQLCLGSIM
jgi:hypothetical protein